MNDTQIPGIPEIYGRILKTTQQINFTMPSDMLAGSLLKTLVASKPAAHILELGTGTGLALSWMVEGLDAGGRIVSIDNDPTLTQVAKEFFKQDNRVTVVCADGSQWIQSYSGELFDLIFADAWPGKYSDLDETIALLKPGGFYLIDDLLPQSNWPEGHAAKAAKLIEILEQRNDLILTKMNWSTGIIIGTKK